MRGLLVLAALLLVAVVAAARWVRLHDQRPDEAFDARVTRPAYSGAMPRPRVAIDARHHEFHTAHGRYAPLATLLRGDGYDVREHDGPLTSAGLNGVDVLVIANAMGARWPQLPGARRPAFTEAEDDAVRDWVARGGALLLVADHEPVGDANRALAARFGVDMSTGRTADPDPARQEADNPTWIVFDAARGAIADHPVTRGRDSTERVRRVVAFTGQSLRGPADASPLLLLSDSAIDRVGARTVPAAGRAMAVALPFGRGRVAIVGEAAMLTAQTTGGGRLRFGMQWPGTDDRRFALNLVRWLSGALPLR